MTDCYSVHLIKLIVMTFYLFTYVVSVFSDDSSEKTVTGGMYTVHKVTFS